MVLHDPETFRLDKTGEDLRNLGCQNCQRFASARRGSNGLGDPTRERQNQHSHGGPRGRENSSRSFARPEIMQGYLARGSSKPSPLVSAEVECPVSPDPRSQNQPRRARFKDGSPDGTRQETTRGHTLNPNAIHSGSGVSLSTTCRLLFRWKKAVKPVVEAMPDDDNVQRQAGCGAVFHLVIV